MSGRSRRERWIKPLLFLLSSIKRFLRAGRKRNWESGLAELWRSGPRFLAILLGDHKTPGAFITLIKNIFS